MATQPPEDVTTTPESDSAPTSRWRTLPFLLIIAVALVVVAIFGFQLMTIVYALIFPPNVTLPPDVVELEHENFGYGSDRWVYGTSMDGLMLTMFFQTNKGNCVINDDFVVGDNATDSSGVQNVGICYGQREVSIFGMRWQVAITAGYTTEPATRFELTREVLWFGLPEDDYIPPEVTQLPP